MNLIVFAIVVLMAISSGIFFLIRDDMEIKRKDKLYEKIRNLNEIYVFNLIDEDYYLDQYNKYTNQIMGVK